jgi:NTE family protein
MSRLSDMIEPNNLRLLFGLSSFLGDLTVDLREDLSLARIVASAFSSGARPAELPRRIFPPFRRRAIPALRGKRIGLVASGGSGALASLCGVRRAFEEAGIEVAAISACSGATLFSALWACGLSAEEMARFWLSLGNDDYLDPDWRALVSAGLHRFANFGGLMRGEALEQAFRRRFGRVTMGKTTVPLYAVMWNVDQNRVEYFGTRSTPRLPLATAVRAAISIPMFVEPVRVGRHLYGDGGVVSIFPVRPLLDFEEPFDLVFGVNCYYPENFAGEEITGWRNRSWAILRAAGQLRACGHLELAREQMRLLGPRLLMLHPVPYTQVRGAKFYESFLDRSRWPRFMRQGYQSTRAMLDRIAAHRKVVTPKAASA